MVVRNYMARTADLKDAKRIARYGKGLSERDLEGNEWIDERWTGVKGASQGKCKGVRNVVMLKW